MTRRGRPSRGRREMVSNRHSLNPEQIATSSLAVEDFDEEGIVEDGELEGGELSTLAERESNDRDFHEKLANTPGFLVFLEKFDDLKGKEDLESIDLTTLQERWVIFHELPEVAAELTKAALEQLRLGKTYEEQVALQISEDEQKAIRADIEKLVFESAGDFTEFRQLSEHLQKRHALKADIKKVKDQIENELEDVKVLKRELKGVKVEKKAALGEKKKHEKLAEAGDLTKEILKSSKDLRKGLEVTNDEPAKAELVRYCAGWNKNLDEIISVQQKLGQEAVKLGLNFQPAEDAEGVKSAISDSLVIVSAADLADVGIPKSIASIKRDLQVQARQLARECQMKVQEVSLEAPDKTKPPGPNYDQAIKVFESYIESLGQIEVDEDVVELISDLRDDLDLSFEIRHAIEDPIAADDLGLEKFREFKTKIFVDFARANKGVIKSLDDSYAQLGHSGPIRQHAGEVAAHSKKGFFARAISFVRGKSPDRVAKKNLRESSSRVETLDQQARELESQITNIEQAKAELAAKEQTFQDGRRAIFKNLESVKGILDKDKEKRYKNIQDHLDSTDLKTVLKAQAHVETLSGVRAEEPDVFGPDIDDDDLYFHGGRTLEQLRKDFSEIVREKVQDAVVAALNGLEAEKITQTGVLATISSFEKTIGMDVTRNPIYKQVRKTALENLAKGGKLTGAKLIAFKTAYRLLQKERLV